MASAYGASMSTGAARLFAGAMRAPPSRLSWSASMCPIGRWLDRPAVLAPMSAQQPAQLLSVRSAWTRRSAAEKKAQSQKNQAKKSWGQRTEKYLKPFMMDVFISNRYIHAKIVHRVTSRVVAVATTNAKDLRNSLQSLCDYNACRVVGQLLAERAKEADIYAVVFELRAGEKYDGKLAEVVDTFAKNGISLI
ncbi:hypothetical protein CBR_g12617 [Chara braunii]|uniref:Uncharacterized protein n=1 Tax=Chara braunii TaxID=69332 RepID=A0A388KS77_CHABU|nr:hypothetical protein CBR_g12617 [Chara braunii]|eukprot:GBG72897.1 hypothetical protein CBR_g12617 [Chara braunii]